MRVVSLVPFCLWIQAQNYLHGRKPVVCLRLIVPRVRLRRLRLSSDGERNWGGFCRAAVTSCATLDENSTFTLFLKR